MQSYKKRHSGSDSNVLALILLLAAFSGAIVYHGNTCTFVRGPITHFDKLCAYPVYWGYQVFGSQEVAVSAVLLTYMVVFAVLICFLSHLYRGRLELPRILKKKVNELRMVLEAKKALKAEQSRIERVMEAKEEIEIRDEAMLAFENETPDEVALAREIKRVRLRRKAATESETREERMKREMERLREQEEARETIRLSISREDRIKREIERAQERHEAMEVVRNTEAEEVKIKKEVERMRIRELAKVRYREEQERAMLEHPL